MKVLILKLPIILENMSNLPLSLCSANEFFQKKNMFLVFKVVKLTIQNCAMFIQIRTK